MDDDYCYECSANGDDYFTNADGELECACLTCSILLDDFEDDL